MSNQGDWSDKCDEKLRYFRSCVGKGIGHHCIAPLFEQVVVVVADSWGDICDHLTKSGCGMVKDSRQVTWIHYNNAGISQHSPNKDLKKAAYNK